MPWLVCLLLLVAVTTQESIKETPTKAVLGTTGFIETFPNGYVHENVNPRQVKGQTKRLTTPTIKPTEVPGKRAAKPYELKYLASAHPQKPLTSAQKVKPVVSTVVSNLNGPHGVCEDSSGYLYVTQYHGHIVNRVNVTRIRNSIIMAGINGYFGFSGEGGLATSGILHFPSGIAVDTRGNVYFADSNNHCIRKVTMSTGIITTVAGKGWKHGYAGDGGLATSALMYETSGVTVDALGNIYIADSGNHVIRKVTVSTGIITTVAGIGRVSGFAGDGGPAISAALREPNNIVVDKVGNIYIADYGNHCIRKVTASTGIITTIAGIGGVPAYFGDKGLATSAKLRFPCDIALDEVGNIYIADTYNYCIRKVAVDTGIITTIAGAEGVPGDRLPYIGLPTSVFVGRKGVYFTDADYGEIKRIEIH